MVNDYTNGGVITRIVDPPQSRGYKIRLPPIEKLESVFTHYNNFWAIGGEVWFCLWFRESENGNQLSLEYNWGNSNPKNISKVERSNGITSGCVCVESYLPIELIPSIEKYLSVFKEIIKLKEEGKVVNNLEFEEMIKKMVENDKNI